MQAQPSAHWWIQELIEQLSMGAVLEAICELTVPAIGRVRVTSEARAGFDACLAVRPAAWVRR
jgi:hypothetical protein